MSKGSSQSGRKIGKDKVSNKSIDSGTDLNRTSSADYLLSMRFAPKPGQNTHWFQMLPAIIFTAVIIMIVRLYSYERPMDQFFWSGNSNQLSDFFSYYKMTLILACAIFAVVLLVYSAVTQSFYIKRSFAYVPMGIYFFLVIISYLSSDYKVFALLGWNDRFEGTLALVSYMVMLFFIINSINSEKNVKLIVYATAITSSILGLLGLTQALGHDFLRTTLGKKLMTPSWFWNQLENLQFTFKNKEIYQTVYNINYVSFYLTLLIPLFGLLFIRTVMKGSEEPLWKKAVWGALFTLLLYNLIGSASSGGLMGMAFVVLMGVIVLNKKIIQWRKPVLILIVLTIAVAGISFTRWLPELTNSVQGVLGTASETKINYQDTKQQDSNSSTASAVKHKIDFIETKADNINLVYNGNAVTFKTDPKDPLSLEINEQNGNKLSLIPTDVSPVYRIDDKRFDWITVRPARDEEGKNYIIIGTDGKEWPFQLTDSGAKYINGFGKAIDLKKVPAIGWKNNQGFGSGRGYIWSRTIPMMKETLLIGHGADTYCIYFPHNDYVGKYDANWNIDLVVDKPHNMYMGYVIGTGGISVLALLVLFGWYIVQSIRLYIRRTDFGFLAYTGAGIFLGVFGFLIAALVNDSSVSVMPMFYGLLGTGISINAILKRQ